MRQSVWPRVKRKKKKKKDSISSFKNRIPISSYFSHKCLLLQFVDI